MLPPSSSRCSTPPFTSSALLGRSSFAPCAQPRSPPSSRTVCAASLFWLGAPKQTRSNSWRRSPYCCSNCSRRGTAEIPGRVVAEVGQRGRSRRRWPGTTRRETGAIGERELEPAVQASTPAARRSWAKASTASVWRRDSWLSLSYPRGDGRAEAERQNRGRLRAGREGAILGTRGSAESRQALATGSRCGRARVLGRDRLRGSGMGARDGWDLRFGEGPWTSERRVQVKYEPSGGRAGVERGSRSCARGRVRNTRPRRARCLARAAGKRALALSRRSVPSARGRVQRGALGLAADASSPWVAADGAWR